MSQGAVSPLPVSAGWAIGHEESDEGMVVNVYGDANLPPLSLPFSLSLTPHSLLSLSSFQTSSFTCPTGKSLLDFISCSPPSPPRPLPLPLALTCVCGCGRVCARREKERKRERARAYGLMNIYEIYFGFCVLLLSSTLVWRLPSLSATFADARRRRSLRGLLLISATGAHEAITPSQGCTLLSLFAALLAGWLLESYSYRHYRSLSYTSASCQTLLVTRALGSLLAVPVVGPLVDLRGPSSGCLACGVAFTAAALLTALQDSFAVLSLAAVLQGVGTALLQGCFESWLVSEWHRRQLSGEWLSAMATLMGMAGGLVGPLASALGEVLIAFFEPQDGGAVANAGSSAPALLAAAAAAALSCLLSGRLRSAGGRGSGEPLPPEHVPLKRRRGHRPAARLCAVPSHVLSSAWTLARSGSLRLLLLQQGCFGAAGALVLWMWSPTLALLDDLLPYGLCGADLGLAAACGASFAGLLLGALESAAGDHASVRSRASSSVGAEVHGRLGGHPLLVVYGAACCACVTLARTVYPVCTMSAFVLLAMLRGFAETCFVVLHAWSMPESQRTTLTMLLRLPEYGFVCWLLLRAETTLLAPSGTQPGFWLCGFLCLGAAVGTQRRSSRRDRKRCDAEASVV